MTKIVSVIMRLIIKHPRLEVESIFGNRKSMLQKC